MMHHQILRLNVYNSSPALQTGLPNTEPIIQFSFSQYVFLNAPQYKTPPHF
jgi:hypothetical protein